MTEDLTCIFKSVCSRPLQLHTNVLFQQTYHGVHSVTSVHTSHLITAKIKADLELELKRVYVMQHYKEVKKTPSP